MDDKSVGDFVKLMAKAENAPVGQTLYWRLIAEDAQGDPGLVIGRTEPDVTAKGNAIRADAKDKRYAAGRVVKTKDRVVLGVDEGALPRKDAEKAITKTLAKDKRLTKAKSFLTSVEVLGGDAWDAVKPDAAPKKAPEGSKLGLTGDDLGLHDRDQATAKKAGGKASTSAEKNASPWVRLLEKLDAFKAEYKGRELTDRDASGARAKLDAIEAEANAWHAKHGKSILDGKKTKARRAEIDTILEQVARARTAIGRAVMRKGQEIIEEVGYDSDLLLAPTGKVTDPETAKQAVKGLDEGRYTSDRKLKTGGEGEVHLLRSDDGPGLVLKVPKEEKNRKDLLKEADLYDRIGDHPNIAKSYGIRKVGNDEGLVMEAIGGGDMEDLLGSAADLLAQGKISKDEYFGATQHMLRGMLRGLAAMRDVGLAHSDVKPLNIMIDDQTGEAKIIDLGLATDQGTNVTGGSMAYMSGELESGETRDTFAVGATAFQAVEGKTFDFGGVPINGWMPWRRGEMWAEQGNPVYDADPKRSKAYEEFVNALMDPDPTRRPTIEQALGSPFLNDSILDPEQGAEAVKKMVRLRKEG